MEASKKIFISDLSKFLGERVWIEGVVVQSVIDSFVLDDSSATIRISTKVYKKQIDPFFKSPENGQYLSIIGLAEKSLLSPIIAHKISDLSLYPDVESLWLLEVPFLKRKGFQSTPIVLN